MSKAKTESKQDGKAQIGSQISLKLFETQVTIKLHNRDKSNCAPLQTERFCMLIRRLERNNKFVAAHGPTKEELVELHEVAMPKNSSPCIDRPFSPQRVEDLKLVESNSAANLVPSVLQMHQRAEVASISPKQDTFTVERCSHDLLLFKVVRNANRRAGLLPQLIETKESASSAVKACALFHITWNPFNLKHLWTGRKLTVEFDNANRVLLTGTDEEGIFHGPMMWVRSTKELLLGAAACARTFPYCHGIAKMHVTEADKFVEMMLPRNPVQWTWPCSQPWIAAVSECVPRFSKDVLGVILSFIKPSSNSFAILRRDNLSASAGASASPQAGTKSESKSTSKSKSKGKSKKKSKSTDDVELKVNADDDKYVVFDIANDTVAGPICRFWTCPDEEVRTGCQIICSSEARWIAAAYCSADLPLPTHSYTRHDDYFSARYQTEVFPPIPVVVKVWKRSTNVGRELNQATIKEERVPLANNRDLCFALGAERLFFYVATTKQVHGMLECFPEERTGGRILPAKYGLQETLKTLDLVEGKVVAETRFRHAARVRSVHYEVEAKLAARFALKFLPHNITGFTDFACSLDGRRFLLGRQGIGIGESVATSYCLVDLGTIPVQVHLVLPADQAAGYPSAASEFCRSAVLTGSALYGKADQTMWYVPPNPFGCSNACDTNSGINCDFLRDVREAVPVRLPVLVPRAPSPDG